MILRGLVDFCGDLCGDFEMKYRLLLQVDKSFAGTCGDLFHPDSMKKKYNKNMGAWEGCSPQSPQKHKQLVITVSYAARTCGDFVALTGLTISTLSMQAIITNFL